jgi:hypothetical protein
VKNAAGRLAASESFADTSAELKELRGISVSAKERERIAEKTGEEIIISKKKEMDELKKKTRKNMRESRRCRHRRLKIPETFRLSLMAQALQ